MKTLNIPSESNEICISCGLWKSCKTPFMKPSGSKKPEVLVIGESPGSEEDEVGKPFVGRSGQLLREVLEELGLTDDTVAMTNVVRCRPENNVVTKKAINKCKTFALQDIKELDPVIVLLLGNSPLNGILGESGISQWNGVIVEKDNRKYLPLYHPAYILRNPSATDEWLEAMLKVVGEEVTPSHKYERIFPKTIRDLRRMSEYLFDQEIVSFDLETSSLDPFIKDAYLLSISFAGKDKSYSFPINHPESWWTEEEKKLVDDVIIDIIMYCSGKLIGHNVKFDQMHILARYDVRFHAAGDTMLLSHLIDSRSRIHGLKRLAGIHLGMYEYERELTEYINTHKEANVYRGGTYAAVPLEILLPYGAMDSEATYKLHTILYEKLSDKQKILYHELLMFVSDVFCDMQANGIVLDDYITHRYERIYTIIRESVYGEITSDSKVVRMIKQYRRLSKNYKFNPNSFQQLSELYYNYYKMPVVAVTKKKRPTTSSKALKILEGDYDIVGKVRYYKLLTKMLSTYLIPAASGRWKSGDGKVRTVYNMHGTRTGRISHGGNEFRLNLANIPTPEKEPGTLLEILPIKNIFTHSYVRNGKFTDFQTKFSDGVIMSVDYSGMELRCFASLAKCEPMLKIHRSGRDFHAAVAVLAMTRKPVHKITDDDIAKISKAVRYRFKWTNWTLLYGGSAYTLHNIYGIPMNEAEEIFHIYHHTFPEVQEYMDECIEFAELHGYIESPFGRREHLYYINDNDEKKRNGDRRAAVNMPVQSAAYDTLATAMVVVQDKLKKGKYHGRLNNNIYDSLTLDVPREEVYEVAELCRDSMENIIHYAKNYFPNIDFSWLISPLNVDVEVGSHYGSLVDIEEWKSEYL